LKKVIQIVKNNNLFKFCGASGWERGVSLVHEASLSRPDNGIRHVLGKKKNHHTNRKRNLWYLDTNMNIIYKLFILVQIPDHMSTI
jgi:hypothetical protein